MLRVGSAGLALITRTRALSRASTASLAGAVLVLPLAFDVTAPVSGLLLQPTNTAPPTSIPAQNPLSSRMLPSLMSETNRGTADRAVKRRTGPWNGELKSSNGELKSWNGALKSSNGERKSWNGDRIGRT